MHGMLGYDTPVHFCEQRLAYEHLIMSDFESR
ncbi:MAG: hypothetical protein GX180_03200 [Enterococcus sp.]|nr:hypothetical protein [Enterococcus sp.]